MSGEARPLMRRLFEPASVEEQAPAAAAVTPNGAGVSGVPGA